jgi:type I restriction enzyme S subunit
MTGWRECKLGDLLEIKHGYAFKGEHFTDSGKFVLLTPGNFKEQGGLKLKGDKEKFYSGEFPEEYLLQEGDIVIAMTDLTQNAPILGSSARIPQGDRFLHNQRLGKIANLKTEDVLPEFVFYLFNSPSVRGQIKGSASGATVRHTAPSRIYDVTTLLPPLTSQRRIAGILSAYDELIENSQRRIKILEAMARALYREWFVHFRFPGNESVPRVPSPLGDIPQGWKVKRIGDCFQTVLGGTPSRSKPEFWKGGTIPWINSGKVNDLRITEASEFITPLALQRSAAKLMPKGTTVLAITGATLGQVSLLEIETAANQSVVGIVDPADHYSEWVYLTISERIEGIIKHASGGAQQHINKEIVNDVKVVLPPHALSADFKDLVAPMFRELAVLLFQIRNLRRTRDLLLPRLLSGQIGCEGSVP